MIYIIFFMSKIDYLKDLWDDEDEDKNIDLDNIDINDTKQNYKRYIINKGDTNDKLKNIIVQKKIEIEIPPKLEQFQVKELISIIQNL